MNAKSRAEYIVDCIREGGSMYPYDAARFLAKHDAHTRAQALAVAADRLDRQADAAEARVAQHYGAHSGIGPGSAEMVREAARSLRDMAREGAREDEAAAPEPLTVRWDRTVSHPAAGTGDDTVVCCLTDDGRPVALLLDDELREALGAILVDPTPEHLADTEGGAVSARLSPERPEDAEPYRDDVREALARAGWHENAEGCLVAPNGALWVETSEALDSGIDAPDKGWTIAFDGSVPAVVIVAAALAAAEQDVPALLAEVERARAQVAEMVRVAMGRREVRLFGDPVDEVRHLRTVADAQLSRADALDRIARDLRERAERAEARVAELEAGACACFAADMHAPDCSRSRLVVDGVEYSAAHWYQDRDGGFWVPIAHLDGSLDMQFCGAYEPMPVAQLVAEHGPITRTEVAASTPFEQVRTAGEGS